MINSNSGRNRSYLVYTKNTNNPGGAIKGWIAPDIHGSDKSDVNYRQIRFKLTDAWNTNYKTQLKNTIYNKPLISPFRVVNNAGDILSRSHSTRHTISSIPVSTSNQRYVYDGSDYVKFLKQQAVNRNFHEYKR